MQAVNHRGGGLAARWLGRLLLALTGVYLLLLLPETEPPQAFGSVRHGFVWNSDAFWSELQTHFREAQALNSAERAVQFNRALEQVQRALDVVATTNLPPAAPIFDELEAGFFRLAPIAGVTPERLPDFTSLVVRLRRAVKWQSQQWSMDSAEARQRIYRLLYGARAAVEEAMLQSPELANGVEWLRDEGLCASPGADLHGVKIRSGDILVSRGGAATSALIARGNDFPGNFSHIALAHVDEATKQVRVIESHIESGVGIQSIESYLADTKLRIMVLRLRSDLPQLTADHLLPHKVASFSLSNVLDRHIPYDFAMDYHDSSKQFCSEVASAAYREVGIELWMGISQLSTPGVRSWLGALGVRHFETQEPSDLEYDPQLQVVAEWRAPETLFNDHADNAVVDVMLEAAERGEELRYNFWMLPLARLAKSWSVMLNWLGKVGPVPEGMSPTTALRVRAMTARHAAIKARLLEKVQQFKAQNAYVPPYWELVRLAREARDESGMSGN